MGGLVVELACADNRDYQVRTLQELFEGAVGSPTASVTAKSSGGRRSSVEAFLKRLLGSVMAPLYRDPVQQQRRINHLYAVPKPAETQDLREICDKYLEGAREDLLFTGLGECAALQDGSSKLLGAVQTDFRDPRPILICSAIHGDLNPRNCLIDGAENVHLIDFASLGEGALAKDFARIECEILFRLASCSGARGYYSLLPILLGPPDLVTASQRTACLPLSEPMLSAAAAVLAVRMEFMAYGATRSSRRELQQDYAAALSATAVRLALFTDYLTDVQTSAALVYALLALDKLRGDS